MSPARQVPTSNYVSHHDPGKSHHCAWLQAVLDRLAINPTALQEGVNWAASGRLPPRP